MIALAQHLRRSPSGLGRSVLLFIALTAALIFGLLAMHALNGPTSHIEPPAAVSVHDAASGSHSSDAPASDDGCPDCGGHEAMFAMACMFALAVVSLLLLIPRSGVTWGGEHGPTWILSIIGRVARSRPPSLLVLCISRT